MDGDVSTIIFMKCGKKDKPSDIILFCGEDLHKCKYDYFVKKDTMYLLEKCNLNSFVKL